MNRWRAALFPPQTIEMAKRWALGCMKSRPAARKIKEAGFTQPRAYLYLPWQSVRDHPRDLHPAIMAGQQTFVKLGTNIAQGN